MKFKGKTNRTHIHYITVVLVLLCTTCLDPFPLPDVSIGYLVVEARFTDDPETNQVILSFAGRVNEGGIPVTGASVYVTGGGGIGLFEESGEGLYLPQANDYYGIAGRKYVLHIELPDGRRYRSDSCLFMDVPPIEDFYWELKQAASPDNTRWLNGIEFKIDTQDPENIVQNFMWIYDETWETTLPFAIREIYHGNREFEAVYNPSRCFFHNVSSQIMIKSTGDQSETLIRDHPIVFISNESPRLFRQYRITVRQFNLSEVAYFYHEQLHEITSQTGSVFDKQPYTLRGNIWNTDDPSEIVMGYFMVSGVSTRSITIKFTELPPEYWGEYPEFQQCVRSSFTYPISSSTSDYLIDRIFNRWLPRRDLIFVSRAWEYPEEGDPILVGLLFAPKECTYCKGTTEIPENWDYFE